MTKDIQHYTYNYCDNKIPSFEQMCTYKSIYPININNSKIKQCFEWLEQNEMHYKLLLEDYLETIYNFAGSICDGEFIATGIHKLQYNINEFWHRNINDYDFYNPYTDTHERKFSETCENRENLIIEEFNVLISSDELTNSNFTINIIYDLQKQLNPNKYKYKITDLIPNNIQINVMNLLYYISNQLVQLSHDVIFFINQKIDKYKENNNADKINIKNDVIQPLSWILELVAESVLDNGLIINILKSNNNLMISNNIRSKFKKQWYHRRYKMWDSAYEQFSVYFQDTDYILNYYKSKYCGIWNIFELKLQEIHQECTQESLTKSKLPIWERNDETYKDVYEILSDWIEMIIEWCIPEYHYKIGQLLTNSATTEEIINICKECFKDQYYYLNTFVKLSDKDKNNTDVLEIFNNVQNKVGQLQHDIMNSISYT